MFDYFLSCKNCGHTEKNDAAYKCPVCGYALDVTYELNRYEILFDSKQDGIFKYHSLLPTLPGMLCRSLGEGDTPLLRSIRLGALIRIPDLYFKNEACNPSGSFKDRALALAVNRAKAQGKETIIVASAGNGSASACAYAASLGLRAIAVVPQAAPAAKISQAVTMGATVFRVPGSYSNAFKLAHEAAEQLGFYNVTTTYLNPFAKEGYKTAAYELYRQMPVLPDWIAVPIGAGPFLAGLLKGFEDLKRLRLIEHSPRLICVQTQRCSPIARAFFENEKTREWDTAEPTVASGIDDALKGYSDEGDYTIDCIRKSGGTAVVVPEEALYESVAMLASMEGIYAEPAGACGVYGVKTLRENGTIRPSETVVIMVTGHGLKNPIAARPETDAPVVESIAQLREFLSSV